MKAADSGFDVTKLSSCRATREACLVQRTAREMELGVRLYLLEAETVWERRDVSREQVL